MCRGGFLRGQTDSRGAIHMHRSPLVAGSSTRKRPRPGSLSTSMVPSIQFHEGAGDGEAEAGAAGRAVLAHTDEGVEDAPALLVRDARPAVLHLQMEHDPDELAAEWVVPAVAQVNFFTAEDD